MVTAIAERAHRPAASRGARRSLSRGEIHEALTDVSAARILLAGERLRLRHLLEKRGRVGDEERRELPTAESLVERERVLERRIEELEARTADLRAELERASREPSAE
jgi:hypothetical protein